MSKTYIITEDLLFLMQRWVKEKNYKLPRYNYFLDLTNSLISYLHTIFPDIQYIYEKELSSKLKEKISQIKNATLVSIDQIYNNTQYHLQTNRIVNPQTMEIIGEGQRPGYPPLKKQIKSLPNDKPLVLVDDGCFSGETLLNIYNLIKNCDYQVNKIIIGLMIDKKNNHLIKAYPDVIIESVYEYGKVKDWICQRDFLLGVPLSGKTAGIKKDGQAIPLKPETALSYCLPFGDPVGSASIPKEKAKEYSRFIILLSIDLWKKTEQASNKIISCREIPRLPRGIKPSNDRFVNVLTKYLKQLK